jgi:hypothetical protein
MTPNKSPKVLPLSGELYNYFSYAVHCIDSESPLKEQEHGSNLTEKPHQNSLKRMHICLCQFCGFPVIIRAIFYLICA